MQLKQRYGQVAQSVEQGTEKYLLYTGLTRKQQMDEALNAWRDRPLGEISYLIVDARYEKVREGHQVIDMAVLSAVGVMPCGRRSVLGTAVALNEVEVNWRAFLKGLIIRRV